MFKCESNCLLCGLAASQDIVHGMIIPMSCRKCGRYLYTVQFALDSKLVPDEARPYLSIATRSASDAGNPITLDSAGWVQVVAAQQQVRVSEKLSRLLQIIASDSKLPGSLSLVTPDIDHSRFGAVDAAELREYLDHFVSKGLLRVVPTGVGNPALQYKLTIDGWREVEPLMPSGGDPDRCFVAMWFSEELDEIYQLGFAPAIRNCGMTPYRVKEDPTNEAIIDRILAEIRRCSFVVADFTGGRPSVYYEAGFAKGLGRPVIWCCREDYMEKLAFDTRHLGHVVWKTAEDAAKRLENSIRANIVRIG